MAEKTYIVKRANLCLKVAIGEEKQVHLQVVPVGSELIMEELSAIGLVKAGKLELKETKSVKTKPEAETKK